LGLEYIDLYLIHWPGTAKLDPSDPLNYENRKESWRALEECVRMGKIKSIGVSNYTLKHLSEMEKYATIKPAVHQFELHPAHVPTEIIKYCQDNAIFIQTYASLGEGALLEPQFLKENTEFAQIASKNGCTVPQLLLKWALQHSWGIIPKSVNLDRIKENISLDHFNIDYNDLNVLDEFHKKTSFKKCWNSENVV
jgi:methylglyoxal/glyoxal reductase